MKTLYININSEPVSSSEDLVVMDYDLIDDFFFYLGERIGKGCKIQNENALITDFNTPENKQDYDLILSQWYEVKRLLFSEEVAGSFDFELPSGYLHWLRYNEDYNHVYEANFSNGGIRSVKIDLKELYEDSVEYLQRKIKRLLQKEDLYLQIDEIVFNDEDVTCKSKIVDSINEKFESIGLRAYKKWLEEHKHEIKLKETLYQQYGDAVKWPINLECIDVENIAALGYTPIAVVGHDDIEYIILAQKNNNNYAIKSSGQVLYEFEYQNAIPTLTGKYIIIETVFHKFGLIRAIDGKELLPVTYYRSGELSEIDPGFFSNEKIGVYCAILESHCLYSDAFIFIDERHLRIYSKTTWKYIELQNYLGKSKDSTTLLIWEVKRMQDICLFSVNFNLQDYKFIVNNNLDRIYVLRSNENIDCVNDSQIVLTQFGKTSAILDSNLEYTYKVDYVLDKDERVVSESDGMIVIMDSDKITRILDEHFNNIIEDMYISIHNPLSFKNGMALYQISKKKIGCLLKNGELIEIPWNYGNTISDFEVLVSQLILVTKTSGERFIINLLGESVVSIRGWDKIRGISENQFEVYSIHSTTRYEINGNNVFEVL